MREILFRGFCPDVNGDKVITLNGEKIKGKWVEGDFCRPNNICFETVGYDELLKKDGVKMWNDYAVIPETVGQYTGLKDRNGKQVFEGDTVKVYAYGKPRGPRIVKYIENKFCMIELYDDDGDESAWWYDFEIIDNAFEGGGGEK